MFWLYTMYLGHRPLRSWHYFPITGQIHVHVYDCLIWRSCHHLMWSWMRLSPYHGRSGHHSQLCALFWRMMVHFFTMLLTLTVKLPVQRAFRKSSQVCYFLHVITMMEWYSSSCEQCSPSNVSLHTVFFTYDNVLTTEAA